MLDLNLGRQITEIIITLMIIVIIKKLQLTYSRNIGRGSEWFSTASLH